MCGRYASSTSASELAPAYAAERILTPELGARYNVAPTDSVYGVIERADKGTGVVARELHALRWGLVPAWAKDVSVGARAINARVETVAEKPTFKKSFSGRRVVIPADGYYEWVTEQDHDGRPYKQPYYLHPAAGSQLSFAGLYAWWRDPGKAADDESRWVLSTTIITCAAHGPAGDLHDRTPVILPADRIAAWLDPDLTDPQQVVDVLKGVHPPLLGIRAVSTEVNKVGNEGPQLIEPLAQRPEETIQLQVA